MGATALIVSAVASAAMATYSAVDANQERQKAKGVANAQKDAANQAITDEQTRDRNAQKAQGANASATQARALQAIRAAMSASGSSGGSVLGSGATNNTAAPIQTKTLLGV